MITTETYHAIASLPHDKEGGVTQYLCAGFVWSPSAELAMGYADPEMAQFMMGYMCGDGIGAVKTPHGGQPPRVVQVTVTKQYEISDGT